MGIFSKYEKNMYIKLGIFGLMLICWLLPYLNKENYLPFEITGQVLIGVIAVALLIVFKDVYYILEILLLFPFIFSHSLTMYTVPIHLIIVLALVILGLIAHAIIYKQKLSKPKFIIGFIAIGVTLTLGGLFVQYEQKALKMLMLFLVAVAFIILYMFLSSSTKQDFNDLTFLITLLGTFLLLQFSVYFFKNIDTFFKYKTFKLGWAENANSYAMIMLFCFPFTIYYAFKNNKWKAAILYVLATFMLLSLILSYSRGAILSAFISYIILAIIFITRKDERIKALIYIGSLFAFIGILMLIANAIDKQILKDIFNNLKAYNLKDVNGRTPIYKQMLTEFKKQPIFGYGMYYTYGPGDYYLWGHNTFIHSAYTLGILGFLAMLYHHVEKYVFCFKKVSIEKIIVFISFLSTDLYGFIDVSYFFINFMIVLAVILISLNGIYKKEEEND